MSSLVDQEDHAPPNGSIENHSTPQEELKLPKIPIIPPSRGRLMSRKQNKAPLNLPSLKNESDEDQNNYFRNTEIVHKYKSQNDIVKDDDFAIEVQEKLKMILGKDNKQSLNHHSGQPDIQSVDFQQDEDDVDFQAKINQNKELIKMHKQKNQQKVYSTKAISQQPPHKANTKPKTKASKPGKVQSAYEKKMKDYNHSLQNRFLQRKKESLGIISEKPKQSQNDHRQQMQRNKSKKLVSAKDSIEKGKANFGYQNFQSNPNQYQRGSNPRNVVSNKKKSLPTPMPYAAPQSQKKLMKNDVIKTESTSPARKQRQFKDATLFDNIHNFLQNPKGVEKQEQLLKQMFSKMKKKDISVGKLQERIRLLDEKMGIAQISETRSTKEDYNNDKPFLLTQSPMQRTARDWKRVQIKDKTHLNYHQSNFDKEIEYVNQLQDKNTNSLSSFLEHQKIMVGFTLQKQHLKNISRKVSPPKERLQGQSEESSF